MKRNSMDKWTPSEVAIQNALWEVEKIGADEKLTEAVILLQKAKELVADYVDSKATTQDGGDPPPPPPVNPGPK